MAYVSPTLNLLITVVKKATNALNRDFSEIERLQSSIKGYQNFVIAAYEKVEKNLRFEFNKMKPDLQISKELLANPQGNYLLVSPIDGVENFSRGISYFSTTAALLDANNNVLAAVVYNPAIDEMYFAEKGNGAFKEGFRSIERLRVTANKDLEKSFVLTSSHAARFSEATFVRSFGSVALEMAYLAAGKADVVVRAENSVAGLAAGMILVKEAGGYVFEINQKDIKSEDLKKVLAGRSVLAVNGALSKKVYDLVNP
ncbi:MAG: inositol monophosphatase [Alphaproteobacteria bacterium]|nr:inositol monophosphatase [Alphaproteobacteria bacterium]